MCYKSLRAPGLNSHLSNLKHIDILCSDETFLFFDVASRCALMPVQCVCAGLCVWKLAYSKCALQCTGVYTVYALRIKLTHWGACASVRLCWLHAEDIESVCVCVWFLCVCACVQGAGSSFCYPGGSEPISCCAL